MSDVRRFGQVFDQVAEDYDRARPGYPESLVDAALQRGGLGAGSRVVEVGSGTGKLTELLVARGLVVDAVEPGENMIEAARRRIGDMEAVRFHVGRFEDVDLPLESYDALFSATAFHWVDPQVGWAKAASLLKAGGLLALLVYLVVRGKQSEAIEADLHAVIAKHAPEIAADWRPALELDELLAGARARGANASEVWDWLMADRHELAVPQAAELFEDVDVEAEVTIRESTADDLIARLRTTSLYFRIDESRRAAFEEDDRRVIERHGGVLRSSVATVLMTARRA
jgi:ubiquinone/menaquinone biosynthesis C-methylase UbiE